MSARQAFAQAIADQLGLDLDDDVLRLVDCLLARLYLFGFIVSEQS